VIRFPILHTFLSEHASLFDRILIADLFDVIFQGDPFHAGLGHDFVGISEENIPCDRKQKESGATLVARNFLNSFWYKDKCKNLGMLIGGVSQMIQFLEILSKELQSIDKSILKKMDMADQVVANVCYNSGLFSRVKMKVWREADEYRVIWNLYGRANVSYRIGEYRLFADGKYPLLVHMYDRGRSFLKSVFNACPPLFPTVFPYMRFEMGIVD
jgi:hypothetical protein